MKLIGRYRLGMDNVRVYAGKEVGCVASFSAGVSDGGTHCLTVPLAGKGWRDVVCGVMHEAMEWCLHRHGAGHAKTLVPRDVMSEYVFVCDHGVFDVCVDEASLFWVACEGDVRKAWRLANAKRR